MNQKGKIQLQFGYENYVNKVEVKYHGKSIIEVFCSCFQNGVFCRWESFVSLFAEFYSTKLSTAKPNGTSIPSKTESSYQCLSVVLPSFHCQRSMRHLLSMKSVIK